MKDLLHPLIEIMVGILSLEPPTIKMFPFRNKILEIMNSIMNIDSNIESVYIPVAPYVLEQISLIEFTKKTKNALDKPKSPMYDYPLATKVKQNPSF